MNQDIMTDEYATMIIDKGYVSKPYRPSNGTECLMFLEQYCYQCKHDEEQGDFGCDILAQTMCFDVNDKGYPAEWIYNEHGQPTCTAFTEKGGPEKEMPNPNQLSFKGF